jgi:C-terminal processing protease CtpA/Prc
MKIYTVMDNAFGDCGKIHSSYFSKEKAQEKSSQMRREIEFFKIGDAMTTHGFDEDEAKEWVEKYSPILDRLYEVKELEVKE